jgi:hypothetical protein
MQLLSIALLKLNIIFVIGFIHFYFQLPSTVKSNQQTA